MKGDFAESTLLRMRLNCGLLTERDGDEEQVEGRDAMGQAENVEKNGDTAQVEADAESDESRMTIIVKQDSLCRGVLPYVLVQKGGTDEWAVNQVCYDLETVSFINDRIIIKDDQEQATRELVQYVAKNRDSAYGTALEHFQAGESDSNGTVERTIQDVEAQCRTFRAAWKERIGHRVRFMDAIVPWHLRHAGCLITVC